MIKVILMNMDTKLSQIISGIEQSHVFFMIHIFWSLTSHTGHNDVECIAYCFGRSKVQVFLLI